QRASGQCAGEQHGGEFTWEPVSDHGAVLSVECEPSSEAEASVAGCVAVAGACAPKSLGLVLNIDNTTTKKVGTKITANGVAANMPPITPIPTAFWLAALAPEARAKGRTPRIKANEVMRMGRNRKRAASTVASSSLARPA